MSSLMCAYNGLRVRLLALHSFSTSMWVSQRWIYNPSLKPPPTTGLALQEQFQETSAPHLSAKKFKEIMEPVHYDDLYKHVAPRARTSRSPEEAWVNKSLRVEAPNFTPTQFAGRSIAVAGSDVGAAWNILNAVLRQNNVRRELRLTERHEKKGVKRRRLRSERWRRRFADEVRKKVKLVNEIRLRDRMWNSGK